MLPMTEAIPFATMIGAFARFTHSPTDTDSKNKAESERKQLP